MSAVVPKLLIGITAYVSNERNEFCVGGCIVYTINNELVAQGNKNLTQDRLSSERYL